jgi:molecular chaperone GrpE (heat shock protein)
MVMERAQANWTDQRLDERARRVDERLDRLDEHLRQQRAEIMKLRSEAAFDRLMGRFDALERTVIQVYGTTLILALATLVSVWVTAP